MKDYSKSETPILDEFFDSLSVFKPILTAEELEEYRKNKLEYIKFENNLRDREVKSYHEYQNRLYAEKARIKAIDDEIRYRDDQKKLQLAKIQENYKRKEMQRQRKERDQIRLRRLKLQDEGLKGE